MNNNELNRKVKNAALWGYAGTVVKIGIQFIAQTLIARILGPSEYGVFAMAMTVITISILFSDSGIGAALINKKEVNDEDIRLAFTLQFIVGLSVTLLLYAVSPYISNFYNESKVTFVIQILSLTIFISALSSVSVSLLKRNLNFKEIQKGQILAFFVGYIIFGVPLAYSGVGVFSLAVAWLVQSLVSLIFYYEKVRHPLYLSINLLKYNQDIKYGFSSIFSNLFTWSVNNLDKVVVGRYFSSHDFGLYSVPFTLLGTLSSQFLSTLQPLLFSVNSINVHSERDLKNDLMLLLEVMSIVIIPIFLVIAFFPDVIIAGIYGDKWISASEILRPVSVGFIFYILSGVITPFVWAAGEINKDSVSQLVSLLMLFIVTIFLSKYNVKYIACGTAFIYFFRFVLMLSKAKVVFKISYIAVFKLMSLASCLASMCIVSIYTLKNIISLSGFSLLIASILIASLTLTCSVFFLRNFFLTKKLSNYLMSNLFKLKFSRNKS